MIILNGTEIENKKFADNTLDLKLTDWVKDSNIIEWKYQDDSELFLIYCLKRHIDNNFNAFTNILYMPYVPNARKDRVKNCMIEVFTLKYFTEIINNMNFNTVKIFDPHSAVVEGLINNLVIETAQEQIVNAIQRIAINEHKGHNNIVCYFPDNGSLKKYYDMISSSYCYGTKRRDYITKKVVGIDIITNGINLKDKTILMIDDIITHGDTMKQSAEKLKELNCGDIYIYASHIEDISLDSGLYDGDLITKVYTTNSIFKGKHKKFEVSRV